MTILTTFGPDFKDVGKFFVGFDDQFNRLAKIHEDMSKNIPNYPPYNIKKTGDNTYVIEVALAGFSKQDIEIELNDGKVLIKGNVQSDDAEDNFLFKGILTVPLLVLLHSMIKSRYKMPKCSMVC